VPSDARAVLTLVAQLKSALHGNGAVCRLLSKEYRASAERWARQDGSTCGAAVMRNSGDAPRTPEQLNQPVWSVLFFYSDRGEGAVVNLNRPLSRGSTTARAAPLPINIAVDRDPKVGWQITQIGYEF
jgi:hypothetical protein